MDCPDLARNRGGNKWIVLTQPATGEGMSYQPFRRKDGPAVELPAS
jgi:hypothetical protein